jgi:U3 small nucleolar RNA-associated protein 10
MPIFTFMGSSVLRQADDYSAHVVNQTIKEVIPPLIDTFRKSRRNLVASASELLASFVIAYEHIPSPRKHSLFLSLIENLGPEDFLFAVIAMFVDKYGTTDNILGFLAQIMDNFDVAVQLQSLVKLLDLIRDILKPKPTLSEVLLGRNEENAKDPQKTALKELTLLHHVLGNRRLKTEIAELAERDDMESAKIRDIYATLLEDILTLADAVKSRKPLYNRCGEALSSLLNLLSTAEFIKAVETLLDRPNIALRQKVLRALELRVDHEDRANLKSRAALLGFLPQLTAVIRESEDVHYKLTAITCVDKIAEKYGKKDLEAVAAAATTIASDKCLGQGFDQLRVMALLCLASLVDVLQEGIVPVLPVAIPKTLAYLRESLQGDRPNEELHNASYALMTSLAQHLPYMITGAYLDELLSCSNLSAEAGLNEEANDSRVQCLRLLAKLADGKAMFTALEKNWSNAAASGWTVSEIVNFYHGAALTHLQALNEYLDVLGWTLDKHSKATISKNIPALTTTFMAALDLRSHAQYKQVTGSQAEQLKSVEDKVNDVVLKMIYKLNDAAFRPIFSQLMEWSATGPSKADRAAAIFRQQSVYGFLFAFFDGLKSIVTSYATYIVDSAVKILQSANPKSAEESELWKRVLRTLAKCFEHDQDGFWQAPAHFGAVAPVLVEQFKHAPTLDLSEELIPAVVELANAADSQEHQKELNGALLKHLRSEQAAVRLAVVLCEQALTDRLGEDWLSMLPEMLPYISELQDDDDEIVERETHRWIVKIEGILGESLDSMLQ